jgi:type III pantothenate kinase
MNQTAPRNLIAVDIGNSRMKLGVFAREGGQAAVTSTLELPTPEAMFDLEIKHSTGEFNAVRLQTWLSEHVKNVAECRVASVHRAAADRLEACVTEWARTGGRGCQVQRITFRDVPMVIRVDEPARVGIDRLVAALTADRLRRRNRAAIVVDLGSAITVDLVDAEGAFCGGAILPGIAMSARALAEHTDELPHVPMDHLDHPPAVTGKSTVPAIQSGIYWGTVGAVRGIAMEMSRGLSAAPDVFLTGGASAVVARLIAADAESLVHHVPHLVLAGIALVNS